MTSFLEGNLALLAKHQPVLARLLREVSPGPAEILPSAKGLPTARCKREDGAVVPLHSRYDPLQEARQCIAKVDVRTADYFILLGFGLGYNLDALAEVTPRSESHYFIIESNLEILRAAMQARDLAGIISLPRLHFAWPANGPELGRQWREFFDPVHARGSVFVNHIPSIAIQPEFFKTAAETVQSQTFQIFTDINTLVAKSKVFLDNFIDNFPLALASPGVSEFAGKMHGIPGIVVSAGPSLDKNLHELRGVDDKALILSTDTALKPLLSAGIRPHFVLSGDPSHANYLHLKGARAVGSLFVVEATGFPEIFKEFRGRTITCVFENSTLGSLSSLLAEKGQLRAWGSVATMALDFGLLLGCNPIIFVGQDLAYAEGRTYCSGLHWEAERFAGVSTPDEWKARWESLRKATATITMIDIMGNPVETTDKLAAYWNWINKEIQSHPGTLFVNATEGGILRDGVLVVSLREAIYRHCFKEHALVQRTEKLFDSAKAQGSEPLEKAIAPVKNESANLRSLILRGKEACAASIHGSHNRVLEELESIRSSLYHSPHVAPLLDNLNQMGNVTFLRRRATFAHQKGEAPELATIRSTYSDFFDSMLEALDVVDSAVSRLVSASLSGIS